jgi:hypothetical protein
MLFCYSNEVVDSKPSLPLYSKSYNENSKPSKFD